MNVTTGCCFSRDTVNGCVSNRWPPVLRKDNIPFNPLNSDQSSRSSKAAPCSSRIVGSVRTCGRDRRRGHAGAFVKKRKRVGQTRCKRIVTVIGRAGTCGRGHGKNPTVSLTRWQRTQTGRCDAPNFPVQDRAECVRHGRCVVGVRSCRTSDRNSTGQSFADVAVLGDVANRTTRRTIAFDWSRRSSPAH